MVEKRLSHSGRLFKVAEGDLLPSLAQLDQIARQGHQHACSCSAYDGALYTRMALQLMALTFVRTSELVEAQWQEFDLDAAEWTIPAERTGRKGTAGNRRPHLVPLSRQALEVLGYLRTARGADRCVSQSQVFPGERDHEKPMSNGAILMALKRMGYQGRQTGHGFRGIASTWANESGYRYDVIEAQLSHVEGNLRISANVTGDFGNVTGLRSGAGLRGEDCRKGLVLTGLATS